VTQEQATRSGFPAADAAIVLEPVGKESRLKDLLTVIERHELAARFSRWKTGQSGMERENGRTCRVRRQGVEDGAWAALAAAVIGAGRWRYLSANGGRRSTTT